MIAELTCLALAVYYEARSEPLAGQQAVAQVLMQRVASPRYPNTVCGVVKQGPTHSNGFPIRHKCQVSFWCDGMGEHPRDMVAWLTALEVSAGAMLGIVYHPELVGVLHYHALDVAPSWSKPELVVIGQHAFVGGVR